MHFWNKCAGTPSPPCQMVFSASRRPMPVGCTKHTLDVPRALASVGRSWSVASGFRSPALASSALLPDSDCLVSYFACGISSTLLPTRYGPTAPKQKCPTSERMTPFRSSTLTCSRRRKRIVAVRVNTHLGRTVRFLDWRDSRCTAARWCRCATRSLCCTNVNQVRAEACRVPQSNRRRRAQHPAWSDRAEPLRRHCRGEAISGVERRWLKDRRLNTQVVKMTRVNREPAQPSTAAMTTPGESAPLCCRTSWTAEPADGGQYNATQLLGAVP